MPPARDRYLMWLYSQVGDVTVQDPAATFWTLFTQMQATPFVWLVPNDDNRVEDGRELRLSWAYQRNITDPAIEGPGCSFLEMLIALCRRLEFEAGDTTANWFWHILQNLGLLPCTDRGYDEHLAQEAIDRVIWRLYAPDGTGGLFPLKRAYYDQREVEIWYQLNAYLLES
jgi:hypothetical protein